MLQLLALLAISWMVLWFFEKRNLSVLGLWPTNTRRIYFALLFLVSALLAATAFLLRIYFVKEEYILSRPLTTPSVLTEVWYQFRTVLTEELLCRGVLLYILIKKIGQKRAIIITSLLFAVLHWFNSGVWGNALQMAMVFAFTFAMGLLLAYAYARSGSLLLPFAIHCGWNLVQNYIFPGVVSGNHIFVLAGPPPVVTISYFAFFTMLLLPKVSVLVIDYFIVKQYPQEQ